jgi:hypothetical protein
VSRDGVQCRTLVLTVLILMILLMSPGALSLDVNWPGCEADHSSPSSAKIKNAWSYTSTLPIRLHGVVLS